MVERKLCEVVYNNVRVLAEFLFDDDRIVIPSEMLMQFTAGDVKITPVTIVSNEKFLRKRVERLEALLKRIAEYDDMLPSKLVDEIRAAL